MLRDQFLDLESQTTTCLEGSQWSLLRAGGYRLTPTPDERSWSHGREELSRCQEQETGCSRTLKKLNYIFKKALEW